MTGCLADPLTRRLAAASALISLLGIAFILDYSGYPFEPYRYWILEYFLRTQDLSGLFVLAVLVAAACLLPLGNRSLDLVDALARHPWRVAAASLAALSLGALFVARSHPLAQDEYAALFQSQAFAAWQLTGLIPSDLLGRVISPDYMNQFMYGSFRTGQVASAYWPGFAILLTPFSLLGVPWICNALLASLALVLMGWLAEQLSGAARARGWAMLVAVGSPAFGAMAISYFSMTAHLLLNLLFAALLLVPAPRRLLLAGIVGSLALVLHNPLPHTLFAIPWIGWLATRPEWRRALATLAAGYAPLAIALGFGWPLLLSDIQGNTALHGLYPFDDNPLHRIANFFWTWHIKLRTAVTTPDSAVIMSRLAELVRLWAWAAPGLPLLAAAGWWLGRRNAPVMLLGLSMVATLLGYAFIGFNQGHGWGARYLHPAWGVLPVLAAVWLAPLHAARRPIAAYVAGAATLSLVFATALRAFQIQSEVDSHLAYRPEPIPNARQIIFIHHDLPNYTADLVQNDPFLRGNVWYLISFDARRDAEFMRSRFPDARLVRSDRRGQLWSLGPTK